LNKKSSFLKEKRETKKSPSADTEGQNRLVPPIGRLQNFFQGRSSKPRSKRMNWWQLDFTKILGLNLSQCSVIFLQSLV